MHGFTSHQLGEKSQHLRACARRAGLAWCSFDFQGHGNSGGSMRDLTLTRNIEDLHRVVEWLASRGHNQVILIGSSMGGYTSLWYAAEHPHRVGATCHIAPAFQMARGFLLWAGPDRALQWEREGVIRFENDFLCTWLGWEWIADLQRHDDEELMQRLNTPTLILHGKLDDLIPWRAVSAFATKCNCPNVELHLFADGDHRLTDRKDRLWSLIHEFLSGRGILPGGCE